MILAALYTLLFIGCIYYFPFFKHETINRNTFSLAFVLKVLAGSALTYIYSHYYTDRSTADIFKYYDDAKIMYASLHEHPMDYLKMLTGIDNNNSYFDHTYYEKMNHWYRKYDFGTYNDNHTIIRFNALIMLFAFGNFHVHTVFMCFVSFLGLTALYKTCGYYFSKKKNMIFMSLFLLPSLLFWGSGVLKEGILLFSIGFLIYAFFQLFIWKNIKASYIILLVVSVLLQLINKNYLLVVLLPPLLCYWLVERFSIKRIALAYIVVHVFLVGVGLLSTKYILHKDVLGSFAGKQKDFVNLTKGGVFILNETHLVRVDPTKKEFLDTVAKDQFKLKLGSNYMRWNLDDFNDTTFVTNSSDTATYSLVWDLPLAGSAISVPVLKPTVMSFILGAPQALFNSFMQPLPWKADTLFEKMAALENVVIAMLLVLSLIFIDWKNVNANWLMLSIFITCILFLIIGYTTCVAGAIVRYKIPALPFVLLIAINLISLKKLRNIPLIGRFL